MPVNISTEGGLSNKEAGAHGPFLAKCQAHPDRVSMSVADRRAFPVMDREESGGVRMPGSHSLPLEGLSGNAFQLTSEPQSLKRQGQTKTAAQQ